MKKKSTYIISVILSVFLVFGLLGSAAAVLAYSFVDADHCISLAKENSVPSKIQSELSRHYSEKYNSSGIPANVYMDAFDESYLTDVMEVYVHSGFDALENDGTFVAAMPKNQALEDSIDKFFNDYADEIGYEKDAAFEKKLDETKSNAYGIIGSYSDVYKFSAMSSHGVLAKLSKLYRHKALLMTDALGFTAIILLLLMLVNIRERRTVLYWTGICSVIAGVLGLIPCIWLTATKYYNSFTIKQPQVFTAFTGMMYRLTALMTVLLAVLTFVGIVLIILYVLTRDKEEKPQQPAPVISENH